MKKVWEKYICNDNPIEASEKICKMTDKEAEDEFQRRFGKYSDDVAKREKKGRWINE